MIDRSSRRGAELLAAVEEWLGPTEPSASKPEHLDEVVKVHAMIDSWLSDYYSQVGLDGRFPEEVC